MKNTPLKSYMCPTPGLVIISILTICSFGLGFQSEGGLGILVGLVSGVFFLVTGLYQLLLFVNNMEELEKSWEYSDMVADFEKSRSFVYDRIRIGEKYIFGKAGVLVVRIVKVRRLYQYARYNYTATSTANKEHRYLRAELENGDDVVLCRLESLGLSNADYEEIGRLIQESNPGVIIGNR